MELEDPLVRDDNGGAGCDDPARNCDPQGGEEDVLDAHGGRIRGLGVHVLPRLVDLAEVTLALRQWPVGAANPLPRRLDADVEVHGERAGAEPLAAERGENGAAAEGDDRIRAREHLGEHLLLDPPELRLAALEQLGDRAVALLDQPVEVDERTGGQRGDAGADRRLPGAHEPRDGEVAA